MLDLDNFRLEFDIYNTQHGAESSVESIYRMNNMDTRVGDQNLDGPGPDIGNLISLDHLNLRARDQDLRGTESSITNENIGVGSRSVVNPLNLSVW